METFDAVEFSFLGEVFTLDAIEFSFLGEVFSPDVVEFSFFGEVFSLSTAEISFCEEIFSLDSIEFSFCVEVFTIDAVELSFFGEVFSPDVAGFSFLGEFFSTVLIIFGFNTNLFFFGELQEGLAKSDFDGDATDSDVTMPLNLETSKTAKNVCKQNFSSELLNTVMRLLCLVKSHIHYAGALFCLRHSHSVTSPSVVLRY